ncbi:MAG: hypothetical protein JW745_09200 [Sedimentisphaerales bacterium]|nr:hypothetical protein [Sedimentisphaerales bacterium]MBN2841549.1 hypothetical protein [Sedimentisphaerales bacterium]
MAKAEIAKKKPQGSAVGADNDIYTALLGLSFLAMAGTSVWVCIKSMAYFGQIF